MNRSGLIQLMSAGTALALAYGLDRWIQFQERLSRQGMNFYPFIYWKLASGLILFGIWISLAWILLSRPQRSILASILLILLGFAVFLLPFTNFVIPIIPPVFDFPLSAFTVTGIFIAVLSVLLLYMSKFTGKEKVA